MTSERSVSPEPYLHTAPQRCGPPLRVKLASGVFAATFCRGEQVVGFLAAESLEELRRLPGVMPAVEHE